MSHMATFTSIDDYVASFPDGPREILEQVRDAMRRGAPGSEEKIRYGMPALMFRDRYGLHFAGWKKHVGLYPVAGLRRCARGAGGAPPRRARTPCSSSTPSRCPTTSSSGSPASSRHATPTDRPTRLNAPPGRRPRGDR